MADCCMFVVMLLNVVPCLTLRALQSADNASHYVYTSCLECPDENLQLERNLHGLNVVS